MRTVVILIVVAVVIGTAAWKLLPGAFKADEKLAPLPGPDLELYTEGDVMALTTVRGPDDLYTVVSAERDGQGFVNLQLVYGDLPDGASPPEIPGQVIDLTVTQSFYDEVLYGGTVFTGHSITVTTYAVPVKAEDTEILERVGGSEQSAEYRAVKEGKALFVAQKVYSDVPGSASIDGAPTLDEDRALMLSTVNSTWSGRARMLSMPIDYEGFIGYFQRGAGDSDGVEYAPEMPVPSDIDGIPASEEPPEGINGEEGTMGEDIPESEGQDSGAADGGGA